jgi:hypothetical protein
MCVVELSKNTFQIRPSLTSTPICWSTNVSSLLTKLLAYNVIFLKSNKQFVRFQVLTEDDSLVSSVYFDEYTRRIIIQGCHLDDQFGLCAVHLTTL